MNIQTVRDNLKNTIAGKELHLSNAIKIRDEQDLTREQEVANYMTIQFLKVNIAELKQILKDVEQCVEEFEVLKDDLAETNGRVRQLERQASDDSWITNPDRMGGCYSEDELRNEGWK